MTHTISLRRPLFILTGDLGSGKTSGLPLLSEQLGAGQPHFVVNEVGASDRFVGAFGVPHSRLSLLPGGCICCEKKEELVDLLSQLVEHPLSEFDSIFLESSGLADPSAILSFVSLHPKLTHQLKVTSLVYFLDTSSGQDSNRLRPQDITSLAVADVCVLTKTDMIDSKNRDSFIDAVAAANPTVDIFEQRRDIEISLARVQAPRPGRSHHASMQERTRPGDIQAVPAGVVPGHEHVDVLNFNLPFGASWLALSTWLMALLQQQDKSILRVKAAISNDGGWVSINGVGQTLFPPDNIEFSHEGNQPLGTLVLIGFGLSERNVVRSLKAVVSEQIMPMCDSPAVLSSS
jgi:G3E family GTPase